MADLRRTIDEIRSLMQDEVIELTAQLEQLASEFAQGCREANERLRKCEEFLNQGLRAEALHFAELAPNLLDLVGMLDFPELAEWSDFLADNALQRPEPLLLDVAATLNEAYALQEPLQRLLDQHRLYALARSPLTQRLNVLRSIKEIDSGSPHWETDVREMERSRFREIEIESRTALSNGNVDRLKTLVVELSTSPWLEAAPATLLRDLKQRGGHVARGQAREQLELLAVALHGAHASMDLTLGRALRDAWKSNAKTAQLSPEDALSEQAAPMLDWIEDEDRKENAEKQYRRAIQELERGLEDNSLDTTELQQLGHAVEKCGRGIVEPLKTRYRNRQIHVALAETRRNRLRIGGMIAGVLAIVLVIGASVYFSLQAEKSRKILAAVDGLIDQNQLQEAGAMLEQHAAGAYSDAAMKVKQKLTAAIQAEDDRRAALAAALSEAGESKDETRVESALKTARELARTSEEKVNVGKLEGEWTERRDSRIAADESQFQKHIVAATSQLLELDRLLLVPDSDLEIRRRSDDLSKELEGLHGLELRVAKESKSQSELLESRFAAFQKAHAERTRKHALLARLSKLVLMPSGPGPDDSRVSEYRDAVAEFIKAFPNDVRARGFLTTGSADVIRAVAARQTITQDWKRFLPVHPAEVEPRIAVCTQYLTDHPTSPDREAIQNYQAFLQTLLWREKGDEESDKSVKSRIRDLFEGKLVKEGYMLQTLAGKCYYLEKEKDFSKDSKINFKFLAGFNGETKSEKDLDVESLKFKKTVAPPQSIIAAHVWDTASEVRLDEWDNYLKELALSLVAAKEIDPFLRYFLLLRTLEYAASGNRFLAVELKSHLQELHDSSMDLSVSWMDPTDSAARSSRQLAIVLLKNMNGLDEAWRRATVAQDKFAAELFSSRSPIGWIERDSENKWKLRTNWSTDKRHSLTCIIQGADEVTRTWQEIGQYQGALANLKIPASATVAEGTVVFATPLSADVKTSSR